MDAKHIVNMYVGKKARRNWKNILLDMGAVSSGIKPSFLYDFSCLNATQLSKMTADLAASNVLSKVDLQVLGLGEDVFLANIPLLTKTVDMYRKALEEGRQVVVDVSAHLKQPALPDDETVQQLKGHLGDVLAQLQDLQSRAPAVLELCPRPGWNLSTVFGVMLGYPVVYWYRDLETGANCLSMVPLSVYRLSSDSGQGDCPLGARRESADKPTAVQLRGADKSSRVGGGRPIYSFSIPEDLVPRFGDRIDEWFRTVQDRTDITLEMTSDSVTLPAVAL